MAEKLSNIEILSARIGMVIPAVVLGIAARFSPDLKEGIIHHAYEMTSRYGEHSLYMGLSAIFLPKEARMRVREAARRGLEVYRDRFVEQEVVRFKESRGIQ